MDPGRSSDPSREVVVCADILGSFGVSPADIRAQRREYRTTAPPGERASDASLETILAEILNDPLDRTTTMRQLICRSDRGLSCSARYAQTALARELGAMFESIEWSFECSRIAPAATGRDRLELAVEDSKGRRRETTVTYPRTPLADDNLPAVLHAINDRLLVGTNATVVLLSRGVDRWRAALVTREELEAVQERYGPRISPFDRPLLPEFDLDAYVPDERLTDPAALDDGDGPTPWPGWALERAERRTTDLGSASDASESADVASLIEEAEPDSGGADDEAESDIADAAGDSTAGVDGFEIRGGSPSVSRVRDGDGREGDSSQETNDSTSTETAGESTTAESADERLERSAERDVSEGDDLEDDAADPSESADHKRELGVLSGPSQTTRIDTESFGTGETFRTDADRYLAVGAALGAGGTPSVEGLLEDEEFLPELPAAEPTETRITFDEAFDPDAVTRAGAAAEQSGFEWVDSGSLKTTRVPDG